MSVPCHIPRLKIRLFLSTTSTGELSRLGMHRARPPPNGKFVSYVLEYERKQKLELQYETESESCWHHQPIQTCPN